MRESAIEQRLMNGLRAHGWLAMKFVSPGNSGVPDRIVIGPGGRVLFVELKTDTGKLSMLQEIRIGQLRGMGCDVRVIYGLHGVEDFIREVAGSAKRTKGGDAL